MRQNSKKGVIMPLLLVFLLISQIIYSGLLYLNRINSSRTVNFQDYYQVMIQEVLTQKVYNSLKESESQQLENIIQAKLTDQHLLMMPSNIMLPLLGGSQLGVVELSADNAYQRLFVYSSEIFLSSSGLELLDKFNAVSVNGGLDEKNFPLSLEELMPYEWPLRDLKQERDQLIEAIEQEGFRLIDSSQRRHLEHWYYTNSNYYTMNFNEGSTQVSYKDGYLQLDSFLPQRQFSRSSQFERTGASYLIHWKGFLFEREQEVP